MKWSWKKLPQRRVDPVAIAVLEYELLGIEPKPGSAAALAVGLRRTFGPRDGERAAVVDFPQSWKPRDVDQWIAFYHQTAANSLAVKKSDGSVELLYVDPSGRHRTEETT